MKVEVDQSGKIGDTKVPTALAFSNGEAGAILITAIVKRECLRRLRRKGDDGKVIYLKMFSIGLYLLLKDHMRSITSIVIDLEYPGRDADIKLYLSNLFKRSGIKFNPTTIHFAQVGKNSRAHKKAFDVFKKTQMPDLQITAKDLLSILKAKIGVPVGGTVKPVQL